MTGLDQLLDGSCLCGGVRYRLSGPLRGVINCFCSQCRKTSGHHVAATRVRRENLELIDDQTLCWYQSSASAERGFCNRCGSNLFWQQIDSGMVSVMAGTLDPPTGLHTVENIHDSDKSDYHALPGLTA